MQLRATCGTCGKLLDLIEIFDRDGGLVVADIGRLGHAGRRFRGLRLSLVVLTGVAVGLVGAPQAVAGIDDYPAAWRPPTPMDYKLDTWRYFNRECTSFVAWRLHARNHFEMPPAIGHASQWADWAHDHGIGVNGTPAVGSVASRIGGNHVAWVDAVHGNGTVTIEEYNAVDSNHNGKYGDDGTYSNRTVATRDFQFIHFKDLVVPGSGWSTAPPVIASGRNADGRLEVFYVGGDNAIWQRWQVSPGGRWSAESRLGGIARSVAVATNRDGRLEVFYVGIDNAIWHRWQVSPGGGWSGESRLGGWVSSVAAARNRDGRLEVFYAGGDNAVWHRWQVSPGGGWSTNSRLGGTARDVAVAANADGRLEVFYVGTDVGTINAIRHRWQLSVGGGWSGESRLPAGAASVTAATNRDGGLEVFYIGGDNAIWQRWQVSPGGRWSGGNWLGGWVRI